jgi:propanol-preferring alcohol dehydrogenase
MARPDFSSTMRAMRIHRLAPIRPGSDPLVTDTLPVPEPRAGELLLEVTVCGVCRTELDEIEGRTPPPELPMTPGHQVVGRVVQTGPGCQEGWIGQRVGVAWIHSACGHCAWCRRGLENLCPEFCACGRDAHGGYAEYMTVGEGFAHPLPDTISDSHAAPLLCAGAVGFRALRLCRLEDGDPLGLTGFGASAHLVLMMARHLYPASKICVFARNPMERAFALELGASWAGDTTDSPPVGLSAIIDTTPAWTPVVAALGHLAPGGRLVINAIRKEPSDRKALEQLDYATHLWQEKQLCSVANVTRNDVRDCLDLAAVASLLPEVTFYPLEQANRALQELKAGEIRGAKVLRVRPA